MSIRISLSYFALLRFCGLVFSFFTGIVFGVYRHHQPNRLSQVNGSRTDHTMVRATLRALSQAGSLEMIARKTGKRVHDVERGYKKRFFNVMRMPKASL